MKIGDRLTDRREGWSGIVINLFDDDGDEVDEIDPPASAVVHVDDGALAGKWLSVDLREGVEFKPYDA